jgi:hypothetical protein
MRKPINITNWWKPYLGYASGNLYTCGGYWGGKLSEVLGLWSAVGYWGGKLSEVLGLWSAVNNHNHLAILSLFQHHDNKTNTNNATTTVFLHQIYMQHSLSTVNSFLFVIYQFSWFLWVPANHEFKCSTKNYHLISVWR